MSDSPAQLEPSELDDATPSRGFWEDAWIRFRRRTLAFGALSFLGLLACLAILAPAIAGTRPIVCWYQGGLYFPALAYFYEGWEPGVFRASPINQRYPRMYQHDENAWAIWPLIFQDPRRPIDADEWKGLPANPQYGAPSRQNIFGTTLERVDVFAQLLHGIRIALLVGFVATGISAVIGIIAGAIAGYTGGWVDIVISRVMELFMCIPTLVLIIAVLAILDRPTIWHTMAIIGVTGWTGIARLTRAEFLKLSNMDYVMAARALGAGHLRIMFLHILPNALAPVLVPIAFGIASAILLESGLSFLGIGSQPDDPSWGTLLNAARSNYQYWWLVVFPGTAIFLSVLAFNLVGEGVQESTDPRLREAGK